MEILTRIEETNMLIFNFLYIEDLKMLSCVSKKINDELKNIVSKYDTTLLVIKTLNEIRNKNIGSKNSEDAEHLLLEMYYEMKKCNNS